MANKRFTQTSLADEAVTYALDALSIDDWIKLKDFSGGSKPSTYALSITARLYEDFSRKRFGRPRPPSWLQERGQGWVTLWRMLCLERQWPDVIKKKLSSDYEHDMLNHRILEIKRRLPNCGAPGFSECSITDLGLDDGPDPSEILAGPHFTMDQAINNHIKSNALSLLAHVLNRSQGKHAGCPSNELEAYTHISEALAFSEEDCLLITLAYEDGLSSRKISELVGQSPSYIQRQLKRIRALLGDVLLELGVDMSVFNQESDHA